MTDISFEMPTARGHEVHRWGPDGQPHDLVGDVSIEFGDSVDLVTVKTSNFAPGDLAVVQTLPAGDRDATQRTFRVLESGDDILDSRLEREASLYAVDGEGTWRSVGESVQLTPLGTLEGTEPDASTDIESYVATMTEPEGSRVTKWLPPVTRGAEPSVEFDIRAYESTEVAYEQIRAANDLTNRTIVEVANEGVVGVVVDASGGPYVVAVTAESGSFEAFESPRDLALTVASGTEPRLLEEGAVQASLGGLDLSGVLANGTDLERVALGQVRAELDLHPTIEPEATSVDRRQEQHVMWSPEKATFRAIVVDLDDVGRPQGEPVVFGSRPFEFVTAKSLTRAMTSAGVAVSNESIERLADIEATQDGPRFVGVQAESGPQLALLDDNEGVQRLEGRMEHSPDGPNWGFSGNGPREASSMIGERVLGEPASAAVKTKLLEGVVSDLPDEFSMKAKDAVSFLSGGPPPEIALAGNDIETVRAAASATAEMAADVDLRAPALEIGDLSL